MYFFFHRQTCMPYQDDNHLTNKISKCRYHLGNRPSNRVPPLQRYVLFSKSKMAGKVAIFGFSRSKVTADFENNVVTKGDIWFILLLKANLLLKIYPLIPCWFWHQKGKYVFSYHLSQKTVKVCFF